jgi:diguanylate cyclase (GGDEF)-like protein
MELRGILHPARRFDAAASATNFPSRRAIQAGPEFCSPVHRTFAIAPETALKKVRSATLSPSGWKHSRALRRIASRLLPRRVRLLALLALVAPITALSLPVLAHASALAGWVAAGVLGLATGYLIFLLRRTAQTITRLRVAMLGIRDRQQPLILPSGGAGKLRDVVETYNQMAAALGSDYATHGMIAQIDRAILAGGDIEDVMKNVVRGLRAIVPCEAIAVGLFDGPSRDAMNVYLLRFPSDRTTFQRGRLAIDEATQRLIPAVAVSDWSGGLPLPERVAARLHNDARLTHFTVLPVNGLHDLAGVVVLAQTQRLHPGAGTLERATDLAGRLEIAVSTAERNRRLRKLAHSDALTGLPNRPALLTLLTNELERARRRGTRVAVLFLDLDRFKQVNDTLGHAAGDALLQSAAERIRNCVRQEDTVARNGGDEFTIVLGDIQSPADAGAVARQLIKSLSRAFEIEGKIAYVGASAGIAIFPDDGGEPVDLMKKADTAMYRAKEEGRSRFAYFEEKMNVEAQRRAALDSELRRAFEQEEFVLHYQPQFDLASGRIFSVEALLRWQHPDRGLLYPDTFVPFAEESGLIDAIGGWVLREACRQHHRWRLDGVPIPRVAVNVSIRQLRRSNFVHTVETAIARAELPPDSLELEVTESMFLQGDRATQSVIASLAGIGVRFAIDDFGTGYSSFSYLKTVPATVLKLDRSFIRDAAADRDAGAIVEAMINMARILRKEVVAEGVETIEQLEFLRGLGCERVQGFYFSRALPADEMARYALDNIEATARDARATHADAL